MLNTALEMISNAPWNKSEVEQDKKKQTKTARIWSTIYRMIIAYTSVNTIYILGGIVNTIYILGGIV